MKERKIYKCRECEETTPENFYKGSKSLCKACTKLRRLKRYHTDPTKEREYQKQYNIDNREKLSKQKTEWCRKNKDKRKIVNDKYNARNLVKRKASQKLNNAIRDGKLSKETICSLCGSPNHVQAHHDDYAKPLTVRWLCV